MKIEMEIEMKIEMKMDMEMGGGDRNGEFDSNILIRSFLIKDKKINIYAGCGIVIDSNPEEETNELKWKLLPLIDSLK